MWEVVGLGRAMLTERGPMGVDAIGTRERYDLDYILYFAIQPCQWPCGSMVERLTTSP